MKEGLLLTEKDRLKTAFSRVLSSIPKRIPVSTYRLQFNRNFTFKEAEAIVGYLDTLGITYIYSSPYFTAKEGSTHGYDIIDHSCINPEIGTEEDFSSLASELRSRGMGLIMDIVPNHMSIASSRNAWWQDVLENGPASPYASFFDIDWKPVKEVLEDKVILPILGGMYGEVLENQELALSFKDGAFAIHYYDHTLPVDPSTYTLILTHREERLKDELGEDNPRFQEVLSIVTALRHLPTCHKRDPERITERLREKEIIKKRILALSEECPEFDAHIRENVRIFNGDKSDPESFDLLDSLLSSQVYRLAYWQAATEEINYRRFFDINDLAAIRTEEQEIFLATHGMVLRHIREGKVTGLRADHPDGLRNPNEYFMRLQEECFVQLVMAELSDREKGPGEKEREIEEKVRRLYHGCMKKEEALKRPFYVVGEKILMENERIPGDWPLFGTTGYVFMNSVNGLFVHTANAKMITGIYERFIRRKIHYPTLVYGKKKLIMESSMASEINVLGHNLNRISESDRRFRDFTLNNLINAIVEVIAFFPVYRTYTDISGIKDRDARYIETAISRAKRHRKDISGSVFDFVRDVLTLNWPEKYSEKTRRQWLDFTMKFQQLTGPVMAKGLEDSVFYEYNRLVSLNEVGGNPDRFGTRTEAFHGQNIESYKNWPHTMVATSTHDSKRSEDVRARINVLSELPYQWRGYLTRWGRMNRKYKERIEGQYAPDRNDEYLLYQTLLGAWPMGDMDGDAMRAFTDRIRQYMLKAAREAKLNTSWINPDIEYEDALLKFIESVMTAKRFLDDFRHFQRQVAHYGMFNSLSQTLLKITSPGVPDFYQGTELWSLSLVDPDNRRPVDYQYALGLLDELRRREESEGPQELALQLLNSMEDGRIKLYLTHKALNFRKARRELFADGEYIPLYASGPHANRIVAFERRAGAAACITAVPRFLSGILGQGESPLGDIWGGTYLMLPEGRGCRDYRDAFTGRITKAEALNGQAVLPLDKVLADFPVALMEEVQEL